MNKPCKDCEPGSKRPTPHPGPRCTTHHRAWRKRNKALAHGRRLESGFELTLDEYMALKAWQGGTCYGCGRARGQSRNLCVDHDHNCDAGHPPERGCRKCIRSLLCSYCNEVEGRLSVEALARLIEVKVNPPAQRFFRGERL